MCTMSKHAYLHVNTTFLLGPFWTGPFVLFTFTKCHSIRSQCIIPVKCFDRSSQQTRKYSPSVLSLWNTNVSVYMSSVQCFKKATIIYKYLLTWAVTMQDTMFRRSCSIMFLLQHSWRCGLLISS